MKLTKSERHTAYVIMLAEAENKKFNNLLGFCYMATILFGIGLSRLTELNQKRPKIHHSPFWFSRDKFGWQKRIELLKQCIIETY